MAQIFQLSKKLLWSHIKEMYQNEWVELIDCDWQSERASPRRAIVRHHAADRSELLRLIDKEGEDKRAVILYVGLSDSIVSAGAAA